MHRDNVLSVDISACCQNDSPSYNPQKAFVKFTIKHRHFKQKSIKEPLGLDFHFAAESCEKFIFLYNYITLYCGMDAICQPWESVRFASERSRVRIPSGPPSKVLDEHLFLQRRLYRAVFALIRNRKAPSWEESRDGAFLLSAHSISAISPATMVAKINRRLYKFTFSLTLSAPVQQGQIF